MPNRTTLRLLFVIFMLAGCGRKAPPKPPEDFAPLPVKNLNVQGTVEGLSFTWDIPDVDLDQKDEDLIPLSGFIFQRADFVRDVDDDFTPLSSIDVDSLDQTTYLAEDTNVVAGHIYDYQVLPYNGEGGTGEPGQTIRVTFLGEHSRVERIIVESTRAAQRTVQQVDTSGDQ